MHGSGHQNHSEMKSFYLLIFYLSLLRYMKYDLNKKYSSIATCSVVKSMILHWMKYDRGKWTWCSSPLNSDCVKGSRSLVCVQFNQSTVDEAEYLNFFKQLSTSIPSGNPTGGENSGKGKSILTKLGFVGILRIMLANETLTLGQTYFVKHENSKYVVTLVWYVCNESLVWQLVRLP